MKPLSTAVNLRGAYDAYSSFVVSDCLACFGLHSQLEEILFPYHEKCNAALSPPHENAITPCTTVSLLQYTVGGNTKAYRVLCFELGCPEVHAAYWVSQTIFVAIDQLDSMTQISSSGEACSFKGRLLLQLANGKHSKRPRGTGRHTWFLSGPPFPFFTLVSKRA